MALTHAKTNNITNWTQAQLDTAIAAGQFTTGTVLNDIVLPSDWNAAHSGTLETANGGTGTATAFTQGSIIYAGASGVYSQDNTNFLYQNTGGSAKLGIGVNSGLAVVTGKSVLGTTTGTVSGIGTNLTGSGTAFTKELARGTVITVSGQIRVVTAIASDTSLTVDLGWSPNISAGSTVTINKFPLLQLVDETGTERVAAQWNRTGGGNIFFTVTDTSGRTFGVNDLNNGVGMFYSTGGAVLGGALSASINIASLTVISNGTTRQGLVIKGLASQTAALLDIRDSGNNVVFNALATGLWTQTQSVFTTGSPTAFTLTGGAHTTLTASTEAIDVNLNLARTVQFAQGALTTQRAMFIGAPTYAFATGASTITNAATLWLDGAPIAGTNASITNSAALWVNSGQILAHSAANSYGFVGATTTGMGIIGGSLALQNGGNSGLLVGGAGSTVYVTNLDIGKFLSSGSKITGYSGSSTAGWGVPAIYGAGRSTAQTAAVASVATYTVGAADGTFLVNANVLVTTSTLHNFTVTCSYTDEGNTSRVLTLQFSNLAGTFLTAIANAAGAVPYEGVPLHIRCKASTAITIASAAGGTYTTVTYNIEGFITQIG